MRRSMEISCWSRWLAVLAALSLWTGQASVAQVPFVRGDANVDGRVDVADAAFINSYIFFETPGRVSCRKACNVLEVDGQITLSDSIATLIYLFLGGQPMFPPFPDPGLDPIMNDLSCESYSPAEAPRLADLSLGFEGFLDRIEGEAGEEKIFDLYSTLTTSNNTTDGGAEAWSIGVKVDNGTLESVTLDGVTVSTIYDRDSDSDPRTPPIHDPAYDQDLGNKSTLALSCAEAAADPQDPARSGAVSAVLFKLQGHKQVLQPSGTARIARLTVKAKIPATGCASVTLSYEDGLQGKGRPVRNTVSIQGTSQTPSLGSCSIELCARAASFQRPGDANQDGGLDISDAVWVLEHLFVGNRPKLPCEGGTASRPGEGELQLVDINGDRQIDISDPVAVLTYLFVGGKPPVLGKDCVPLAGCADVCR